jgi:hypothetical protein
VAEFATNSTHTTRISVNSSTLSLSTAARMSTATPFFTQSSVSNSGGCPKAPGRQADVAAQVEAGQKVAPAKRRPAGGIGRRGRGRLVRPERNLRQRVECPDLARVELPDGTRLGDGPHGAGEQGQHPRVRLPGCDREPSDGPARCGRVPAHRRRIKRRQPFRIGQPLHLD